MTTTTRLLEQRCLGHAHVRTKRDGVAVMREAGSANWRCPGGSHEAPDISTAGGVASGDSVHIKAEVGTSAALTTASQTVATLLVKASGTFEPQDGASNWNGKLIARLLTKDGFHLRKSLIRVLNMSVGRERLPKFWTN
jgi:urease accessory protein UreH